MSVKSAFSQWRRIAALLVVALSLTGCPAMFVGPGAITHVPGYGYVAQFTQNYPSGTSSDFYYIFETREAAERAVEAVKKGLPPIGYKARHHVHSPEGAEIDRVLRPPPMGGSTDRVVPPVPTAPAPQ